MIIKYKGKPYEIIDELEPGEMELDMLTEKDNLEDTIEFPNNFLEQTMQFDNLKEQIDKESNNE